MAADLPVLDQLRLLANTGAAVLGPLEFNRMECLLESIKEMLQLQATAFVESAQNRPILLSFSNDGTPVKARHRSVYMQAKDKRTHSRSARQTVEVLVQQAFL
eukprot:5440099-Lingulodinium_polyedra.AAC.1